MNNINGVAFHELEVEKYWSFPKSYKGNKKDEVRSMVFSGEYIGSRKMDGSFYRFIKDMDGNMTLQGRSRGVSGEFNNKIDWIPQIQPFFDKLPCGTCLLGEIYFPDNEGSANVNTIMLCKADKAIERQKTNPIHYYVFDILAYDGKSFLSTKMVDRAKTLKSLPTANYVEIAEYYYGKELWEHLQEILANNGEGVVITKAASIPSPGKRPARKTLKIKKELEETIDCVFTGRVSPPTRLYNGKSIDSWKYWEDPITGEKLQGEFFNETLRGRLLEPVTKPYFNKWAGSLEIGLVRGEKLVPIGWLSGLSDEIKADHQKYKGKAIEITAMEVLETGGLRHAKLIGFRPDLTIRDCTWEKVFDKK